MVTGLSPFLTTYVLPEDETFFGCSSFTGGCEGFTSVGFAFAFSVVALRGFSPMVCFAIAAVLACLFSGSSEVGGTNERSRVLMALNAMIPDTATTCKSKTISRARDNFMFGSGMPSNSIPAADARRAVAARTFFCLKRRGILIGFIEAGFAPAREIGHRDRRNF